MRWIIALAVIAGIAPAQAQTNSDAKIIHNDIYALGTRVLASDAANTAALSGKLDVLHADMQALIAALKAAPVATTPAPVDNTPAPATLADPCVGRTGKWTTLTVTPADSIGAAMACAAPGFKLTLSAGTYLQNVDVPAGLDGYDIGGVSAATVKTSGQGGCTVSAPSCSTRLAWGKGNWHLQSAGTMHDMEVADSGNKGTDGHDGQAGVYIEANVVGTVTLRKMMFRRNMNGVFANAANTGVDVVIDSSDFVDNSTDGGSHDTYISGGKSLTLLNVQAYGSTLGNNFKSRVPVVKATGGYNRSNQGRWIELADGGTATITGGVYVGNGCCQNVFGNGTESTSKGAGNTTWTGSTVWIGPRGHDFSNAGTFNASGLTVTCASGGSIFNDKNVALTGLACGAANDNPPAVPAFISGAK